MENICKEWLYPESYEAAIKAQKEMASCLILEDQNRTPKLLGGMDVSANRFDPEKRVFASCVVLTDALKVVEVASLTERQNFPYIPGLLGFREAPSLIHAYQALKTKPDLIMLDGQGIAHPRGFGIACHVGLLLDLPTIGVAKSLLVGEPASTLGYKAGSKVAITWQGKVVAMLLRTKEGCNPLIISPGHKISLSTALEVVMSSLKGYRLPEPTRQAHLAANKERTRC